MAYSPGQRASDQLSTRIHQIQCIRSSDFVHMTRQTLLRITATTFSTSHTAFVSHSFRQSTSRIATCSHCQIYYHQTHMHCTTRRLSQEILHSSAITAFNLCLIVYKFPSHSKAESPKVIFWELLKEDFLQLGCSQHPAGKR